jgi:signal transduction histidine kinase
VSPRSASAWLAWSLAGLSVAMFVASVALFVLARGAQVPSSWSSSLTLSGMLISVPILAFPIVGALIASRRPHNPVGWICLADGFLLMLLGLFDYYSEYGLARPGSVPFPAAIAGLSLWLWVPTVGLLVIYLVLLFPDGKLLSRRWRHLAWLSGAVIALLSVAEGLAPGPIADLGGVRNPFGLEGQPWVADAANAILVLFLVCILASASSLILRYRRSAGEVRQQIKWIAFAASFSGLGFVSAMVSGLIVLVLAPETWGSGSDPPLWFELLFSVVLLSFGGVPVAVGIAVLRYRLYDIDLLINRTLVYGALTASVVGIYVLVVGYLGALFQTGGGNLLVSLLATGLVAVLFAPLRDRLQRAVDRLMYGERDDPYAAVSRLGERLEGTLAPEAVLPAIVETVREALKLPYAAIALPQYGNDFKVVATSGEEPPDDSLVLPLSYGGESVGELLLAPRAPGEGFSAADRRLLDGLARHAGVAVHGVRVMADLQRSRERLVLAREEERRRLRRDLHDELAPTLAALGLSAATVGELITTDPKEAAFANEKLRGAIRGTVSDIRRLVYDLRPPALDELGLVEAVRERASRYGVGDEGFRATVEAPDELPPLPAAVEVAAYRIVQEALMNVSRHARASSCSVRLSCPNVHSLEIEVADDGVGLPDTPEGGVGLHSMRERAAELGGTCEIGNASSDGAASPGTRVLARLPLAEVPLNGSSDASEGRPG